MDNLLCLPFIESPNNILMSFCSVPRVNILETIETLVTIFMINIPTVSPEEAVWSRFTLLIIPSESKYCEEHKNK